MDGQLWGSDEDARMDSGAGRYEREGRRTIWAPMSNGHTDDDAILSANSTLSYATDDTKMMMKRVPTVLPLPALPETNIGSY